MKKSLLGLLGALAMSSASAEVADEVANAPAEEAVQGIGSGFSLGLGVGVQWGQTSGRLSMKDDVGADDFRGEKNKQNSDRVFGTFSMGYNHVLGRFLVGLGGAYSFGEKQTSHVLFDDESGGGPNTPADFDIESLRGTAEGFGKVGFLCCPSSLVYIKLSAIWQKAKYIDTVPGNNYDIAGTQTKIAPKISLGFEQKLAGNLSAFAEYGYTFNTKKTYEKSKVDNNVPPVTYTIRDEVKRGKGHSVVIGVAYNIGLD